VSQASVAICLFGIDNRASAQRRYGSACRPRIVARGLGWLQVGDEWKHSSDQRAGITPLQRHDYA